MHQISEIYLEHQERHLTRYDAHRFVRPDAERWERHDAEASNAADRQWWLALLRVRREVAELREHLRRKANFNPGQPRIAAGSEGAGRWTDDAQRTLVADKPGPSAEPPLDKPPAVPPTRPPTSQERTVFLKSAAQWVARAVKHGTPIGRFLAALEVLSWFDPERPYFEAYQNPPKTLEELRDAISEPKTGYYRHHVVEQASAEEDGFPRSMIDGRENLVRIPALKHWEITAWYNTRNDRYLGLSPRDFLRGRSWEERVRAGHEALVKFGVLKP